MRFTAFLCAVTLVLRQAVTTEGAYSPAVVEEPQPDPPQGAYSPAVVVEPQPDPPQGAYLPALVEEPQPDPAEGAYSPAVVEEPQPDPPEGAYLPALVEEPQPDPAEGAYSPAVVEEPQPDPPMEEDHWALFQRGDLAPSADEFQILPVSHRGRDADQLTCVELCSQRKSCTYFRFCAVSGECGLSSVVADSPPGYPPLDGCSPGCQCYKKVNQSCP